MDKSLFLTFPSTSELPSSCNRWSEELDGKLSFDKKIDLSLDTTCVFIVSTIAINILITDQHSVINHF
jgi:hypothetical protein